MSQSIAFPYDRATIRRARTIVKAPRGTYTWPVVKRARTICRTHEAAMKAQNVGRYASAAVSVSAPKARATFGLPVAGDGSNKPTQKQIDYFNHICAEIDPDHVAVRSVCGAQVTSTASMCSVRPASCSVTSNVCVRK